MAYTKNRIKLGHATKAQLNSAKSLLLDKEIFISSNTNDLGFKNGNDLYFLRDIVSDSITSSLSNYFTKSETYSRTQLRDNVISMRDLRPYANGIASTNLGAPTIVEMALFDSEFNNKTEFFPLSNLRIESYASGVWTDITSNYTETQLKRLVGGDSSSSIAIPRGTEKFRVIFTSRTYVFLNALYSYMTTNGNRTKITVWKRRLLGENTDWTQHSFGTNEISNWPGHVYLPFSQISFSPTNSTQYQEAAIEYEPNWLGNNTNITLYSIQIWGGYPAGKRNIFSTDENSNVTFPGDVTASGGILTTKAYVDTEINNIELTPGPKGDDGEQGIPGINATISGATATINNAVGTPGVTVTSGGTSSNRSFAFAFTNLKGEKGDPGNTGSAGTNATITGATATVNNTVGTPGVNVTMGGNASARTFDFAFTNLKGAPGTAATLSVGNTTTSASGGNASVTQRGNAQARIFDFVIPRGEKGEQGEKGTASLNSIDVRGDDTPGSQWDLTPANMTNRSITSYFSQFPAADGMGGSWKSLLNIKGWNGATYASWQLIGPASTTGTDEGLFYRTGNSTSGWSTPRRIYHGGNLSNLRTDLGTATTSVNGLMSSADKTKLNGIATGAQVNRTIATEAQAQDGTNNTTAMTPLRVKDAITANAYELTKTKIEAALAGNSSDAIQLGQNASAGGTGSTAIGREASATTQSTAVGYYSSALGSVATALGTSASASGGNSTALGNDAAASGGSSIALGYGARASGNYSTALGRGAEAGLSSIALGDYASAEGENSIALGLNAYVEGKNSIAIGADTEVIEDNVVDFGGGRQVRVNETPVNNRDAASKKYVDDTVANATPSGTWKQIYSGPSGLLSNNTYTTLTLNESATYYNRPMMMEIKFGASGATYTNQIVTFNVSNNTSTAESKAFPRTVSITDFDGRYFKTIAVKVHLPATSPTSSLRVGPVKTLVGDFTGSSGTLTWTTESSDAIYVYIGKIWVLE